MNAADPNPPIVLELEDVDICYGRRTVLEGVSLAVEPGTVYALLGRNGSGKSSLIRCLLGLQQPSQGNLRLWGQHIWTSPRGLLRRVGVVPERPNAPPELPVLRLGNLCRRLHDSWDQAGYEERLGRAGIAPETPFGKLSRGQQTQVALALALAPNPDFLVLDDPTLGLDAVARNLVFDELLRELHDRSTTVLLATHDLAGVEGVAGRIGILHDGSLALDEDLGALKARFRRLRFPKAREVAAVPQLAAMQPIATRSSPWGVEAIVREAPTPTPEEPSVEVSSMSLEEIFLAITSQEGGAS